MTSHMVEIFASLALLLGLGLAAMTVAHFLQIPDLVLFVAVGVLAGPDVAGWVHLPASGDVGQLVVTGGAVFMLYEGGRAIDVGVLRRIWVGVGVLSVPGVVITGGIVALAAHFLAGLSWPVSLLSGAAVAPTDPATIVPLFRQVRVRHRIEQLVVAESAFNDATGAVLTMTVLAAVGGTSLAVAGIAGTFATLIVVGALVGVGVGVATQALVAEGQRMALWGRRDENAVATLLAMVASYVIAVSLGGSGFMAVFLAGVVRGNAGIWGLSVEQGHQEAHDVFLTLLGTAIRILIFGVLGANVNLALVGRLGLSGLAVIAVLLIVARPITVWLSLMVDRPSRWSVREMLFTSWVRETGVVPSALASLLLAARAPGAPTVAAIIFLAVILTIVVQAPTTGPWAKITGVAERSAR